MRTTIPIALLLGISRLPYSTYVYVFSFVVFHDKAKRIPQGDLLLEDGDDDIVVLIEDDHLVCNQLQNSNGQQPQVERGACE